MPSNTDRRLQSEERVATITAVNMSEYKVAAVDQYGSTLYLSLDSNHPVVAAPQVGEQWVIERSGVMWYLERRYETGDESTSITDLAPGDTRIEAPETLFLTGTTINLDGVIELNGQPLADLLPQPSNTNPLMDGIANPGVEVTYAHGDHIHPTDTTRAPLVSPVFTGIPAAPTAAPGNNTTQLATTSFVTAAISAATPGTGSITSTMILDGTISNVDISPTAAIAYGKLNLVGSIVNADVASAASIAYSKLNLALSIVNGDIANGTLTDAKVNAANKDGTTATPSLRTLGAGAQQAAAGNDSRLSDTRTPTDNTVSTVKLVDGAVTPQKMSVKVDRGIGVSFSTSTAVTFTTPFTAAPVVVPGVMVGDPAANSGAGEPGNYASWVDSITSTGFTLYHNAGGTRTVPWHAIGV